MAVTPGGLRRIGHGNLHAMTRQWLPANLVRD
jgi:hypothetical protein